MDDNLSHNSIECEVCGGIVGDEGGKATADVVTFGPGSAVSSPNYERGLKQQSHSIVHRDCLTNYIDGLFIRLKAISKS